MIRLNPNQEPRINPYRFTAIRVYSEHVGV